MNRTRVDPYGELLLLLAAPAVLPGVGSVIGTLAGLAAMGLGAQLAWGRTEPWLPRGLRERLGHSRLALRLRMWIQRRLRPLAGWRVPPYPRALAGVTAAWSGFLLSLPLAVVPFANLIPGLAIGMVGASLMARRPLFGWIGTLLSAGFTGVLLALGGTVLAALRRLLPGS
jgi:hypothetical protein